MLEHTPTPWRMNGAYNDVIADANGTNLAMVYFHANENNFSEIYNFILRAVNNHERLLEACKMAAGALALITPSLGSAGWLGSAVNDAWKLCAEAIAAVDSPSADDPSAVPQGADLNNPRPN